MAWARCTMGDLRMPFEERSTVVYFIPDDHVWAVLTSMFSNFLQGERSWSRHVLWASIIPIEWVRR